VDAITTEFVREWLTYMQKDHVQFRKIAHRKTKSVGLKPATINTRLKTMKVMFNTLHANRLIKRNPLEGVSNVMQPEELIEVLYMHPVLYCTYPALTPMRQQSYLRFPSIELVLHFRCARYKTFLLRFVAAICSCRSW